MKATSLFIFIIFTAFGAVSCAQDEASRTETTPPQPYVIPWEIVSQGLGNSLEVRYTGGACDEHDHIDKLETDHSIRITVFVRGVPEKVGRASDGSYVCPAVGIIRSIPVELERPLGNRTIEGCSVRDRTLCPKSGSE